MRDAATKPLHLRLRRFHLPAWFTGWYMGRVAGRRCPCEWPIKIEWLMEVCAWIDDEEERHDLTRFIGFHMANPAVITMAGSAPPTPARIKFWRIRHNGTKVEK